MTIVTEVDWKMSLIHDNVKHLLILLKKNSNLVEIDYKQKLKAIKLEQHFLANFSVQEKS